MAKKIVLYGAGGFGREAIIVVDDINVYRPGTYELVGLIDDGMEKNRKINGRPLLGGMEWLIEHRDEVCCAITVGNPETREQIFRKLDAHKIQIETLVSPQVYVDPTCKLGRGCYIGYRCVMPVNSKFGDGVFFNTDVIAGHDLTIGDFSTVWHRATISGNCTIGSKVEIGGAAYVIPGRKIGDNAKIAAGSVVFSNVKAGTTVIGNPAKRMSALEK